MEDVSAAEWIIIAGLGLVVILLIALKASISGLEVRVAKLQKALSDNPVKASDPNDGSQQESAFDQFLAEDPERLNLSKTEQFAAYREWRKVKGMNWSS